MTGVSIRFCQRPAKISFRNSTSCSTMPPASPAATASENMGATRNLLRLIRPDTDGIRAPRNAQGHGNHWASCRQMRLRAETYSTRGGNDWLGFDPVDFTVTGVARTLACDGGDGLLSRPQSSTDRRHPRRRPCPLRSAAYSPDFDGLFFLFVAGRPFAI